MTTITNPVRRTLVLTAGVLAEAAGQVFTERMQTRPGLETAVTIVHAAAETENNINLGANFVAQMIEALTRISPPNLNRILAEAGWQLVEPRILHLILLIDTATGAEQQAKALGQTVVEIIYRHLGVESKVTLIWLADDVNAVAEACVRAAFSFAPQVIALSPLNEDGLRLPDVHSLNHIAAELIWSLTLTPFYQFLAESLAATEDVYTGETPITTLGLTVWGWSSTAVYKALCERWRAEVFAGWLAKAEADPTPEAMAAWLQQAGLDRENLGTAVTETRFVSPPDYVRLAQRLPWPWEMAGQIGRLQGVYRADAETINIFKQRTEPQLTVLKGKADEQLSVFLSELLDTQPVAGIDQAARWTWALQTAWDAGYEQILDESATYDGIDADLADERGMVEAEIRELLETWPGAYWPRWLAYSWRVWHWPRLGWCYWQLRQLGLRLSGLLVQQSARRRQQAVQALVAKTVSELARQARQWHGRVTEIGEMIGSWQEKDEKGEIRSEKLEMREGELVIPEGVYEQLLPDKKVEAAVAAEAIGGFGRQLRLLDDAVLQNLASVAEEQLRGVWSVTAVDLLELNHPTPEAWQTWWKSISQIAAPLWSYDEGQMSEAERHDCWTGVCVMGAGVERLPALWNTSNDNGASSPADSITHIPSADRSQIVVIRIRQGMTVGASAGLEK